MRPPARSVPLKKFCLIPYAPCAPPRQPQRRRTMFLSTAKSGRPLARALRACSRSLTATKGYEILRDPSMNRGTAFDEQQRKEFGLRGYVRLTLQSFASCT